MILKSLDRLNEETIEIEALLGKLRERITAVYVLLDGAMQEAHPPICPKCGAPLIIKIPHKEPRSRFLGCSRYNTTGCRGSMDLDKWRVAAEAALREAEGSVEQENG